MLAAALAAELLASTTPPELVYVRLPVSVNGAA